MLITSFLQITAKNIKNSSIEKTGNDIAKVMQSAMRRLEHDGVLYSWWETTYATSTVKPTGYVLDDYMEWRTSDEVVDGLLRQNFVGMNNPSCGTVGVNWDPVDDNGQNDGLGNETDSARTALTPCSLWRIDIPFGLEVTALLKNINVAENEVSDFVLYFDLSNSELYNKANRNGVGRTGVVDLVRLRRAVDNSLKKELIGSQHVYFGTKGLISTDTTDDVDFGTFGTSEAMNCLTELNAGRECMLITHLDITDTANDRYLRVDGSNDMRASISFAENGTTRQTCAHWTKTGGAWASEMIDCGIIGGADSSTLADFDGHTQTVTNEVMTEGIHIVVQDETGPVPVDVTHLCSQFTNSGTKEDGYVSGILIDTPCGFIVNKAGGVGNEIVQVISDEAFIGKVFASDIMVQDIRANKLSIKYDPLYDTVLMNIVDDVDSKILQINKDGIIELGDNGATPLAADFIVHGDSTVDGTSIVRGDFNAEANSFFQIDSNTGEMVQIQVGGAISNGNLTMGSTTIADQRGITDDITGTVHGFGGTTSQKNYLGISLNGMSASVDGFVIDSAKDLALQAQGHVNVSATDNVNLNAGNRVNINSDTLLTESNQIFASLSTYRNRTIEQLTAGATTFDGLAANEKDLFSYVTKDYVDHAFNMQSPLVLREVVQVETGPVTIDKPDCFDFVDQANNTISNPYFGKAIMTNPAAGQTFARILLVPSWFKTYNSGFGDNQAYTHHAIHLNGSQWEVYQYLSGEGLTNTGAREDGAGSSLALLYCDYTGVDFDS
jgi:hypothetical protein